MGWTYSSSTIDTDLAKVRLLVGDTDSADELIQDEEIDFFLGTEANIYRAASAVAKTIGAKFARQVDKEMGDLKILTSQRMRAFFALAKTLYARGASSSVPTAGGLIVTEKEALSTNTARVQPSFTRGLHGNS